MQRLQAAGIQSRPLWQPIHDSPAYAALPRRECPVASRLHRDALSLPVPVGLTEAQRCRWWKPFAPCTKKACSDFWEL